MDKNEDSISWDDLELSEDQEQKSQGSEEDTSEGQINEQGITEEPDESSFGEPTQDPIVEGGSKFNGTEESTERPPQYDPETDFEDTVDSETQRFSDEFFEETDADESVIGSSWEEETERIYNEPETDLELLQMVDDFLDEIDEDLQIAKERELAGDNYKVSDRFGGETTTQSQLNFDYVRDDGIIVDGDDYIGLQRVIPVRWQSKDEEQKQNIMRAYVGFLKALQWGIAVPCYPKEFNFEKYLGKIYEAGTEASAQGAHPILDYGRRYHILWASQKIDPEKIKRKEFYIVTRIDSSVIRNALAGRGDGSFIKLALNRITGLFGSSDVDVEQACIDEIKQRQQTMKTELTNTGVEVRRVTDRQTSMELLYHYYNHVEPVLDKFEHDKMTEADFKG